MLEKQQKMVFSTFSTCSLLVCLSLLSIVYCRNCPEKMFQCSSLDCVDMSERCDGTVDCRDTSDEWGCYGSNGKKYTYTYVGCYYDNEDAREFDDGPHACGYSDQTCSFACSEYRYFAIQHESFCSCGNSRGSASIYPEAADTDCPNQAGNGWRNAVFEHGAEEDCYGGNGFICDNGQCVSANRRCDMKFDCADKTDEFGCLGCTFICATDGTSLAECFEFPEKICDGVIDCTDYRDELDCFGTSDKSSVCGADKWMCDNGLECVDLEKICDGTSNCQDTTDEHPWACQCCLPHKSAGCSDIISLEISSEVCARKESCCKAEWTQSCVNEATRLGYCGGQDDGNDGNDGGGSGSVCVTDDGDDGSAGDESNVIMTTCSLHLLLVVGIFVVLLL